jgi:elongator complex protein 1
MPRGNLETVHPRGLLLEHIKYLLNNKEYLEAFLVCRKNRLDLNLLIDYDPQSFVENISVALGQIQNPEYINLLIASMKDENVTKTIYKNSFLKRGDIDEQKGKVNLLCDLIVSTLEKFDKEKYLNSILTGLSKKSPPDLENATKRILEIKEAKGAEYADDAIKYLIFLADPNKLFDYALGVYDLELVVMVAQNSQKVLLMK